MNKSFSRFFCFLALIVSAQLAHAVDGVSFEYGESDSGNSDVRQAGVALQWKWNKKWFDGGNWHLGGYWEATIRQWDNNSVLKTNSGLTDIGFTPVFRFQQNRPSSIAPYLEAAIGFHLLSKSSVSSQRDFGSSFQFGNHVGAGIRFGQKGAYDLSYRYQHLSNSSLKSQNNGINFNQIRFAYHF